MVGCDGSEADAEVPKRVVVGKLQLAVPPSWPVRRHAKRCKSDGQGVHITNLDGYSFERPRLPPGWCNNDWDVRGAPRDFVLVDISEMGGPPAGPSLPPDSEFPPALATFAPTETALSAKEANLQGKFVCACMFRGGGARSDGVNYSVRAWIGDDASIDDRRSLDVLLGSIRKKR